MSPRQRSKYWRMWASACRSQGWNSSDSGKRYLVHQEALGKHKSSTAFSNADLDRVYTRLARLIDPDLIAPILAEQDPDSGLRKRVVFAITKFDPSLVEDLSSDKFGTRSWIGLENDQLRQLLMTVQRVKRRQAEMASEAQPF